MKKIKILRTRNLKPDALAISKAENQDGPDMVEPGQSISEESVKVRPTRISLDGFASWVRKIRPTSDGMESEVEKPLLIAKSGHRVKENEIKGQCDICGGYDSYIFNCYVYGCKKSLCLKHVYFFEYGEKKIPYCLEHYNRAVDEFDTWQERESRRR
ncbi:MAG: hypothetical protein V3W31_08930 [Thermodesulfobacteriota bacterium]